ncbi:MAG: hypothetical protein CVT85_11450 [Alphaproteobacteria bacterium HGW-Alphaproteobacteria-7]|nr:MAG: hypothetical protein CVT85_11450 [Alphaproteobacteria bacterium HGW-Alphaproteobacteria-7]
MAWSCCGSPRITSIAVRNLDTGQTSSFSIHQVAERNGVAPREIAGNYDKLERQMLDEFYAHIGQYRGSSYIHWNMRDINYGFAAIEHRYRVLGGEPWVVDDSKKFDLARLMIDIYGVGYTGHPRLETIMAQNSIKPLDFMTGKEEADAFDGGDYVGLHRSTLRKVDVIANLAERAHHRHLKTHTTWWEMHGGTLRSLIDWAGDNKAIALVAGIASIVGLGIAVYTLK